MSRISGESTESLRKNLFIYLAAALFTLMAVLSFTVYTVLFQQLKRAEEHTLFHAAEMRSIAVNEWARRAKDLARQITSRSRIREELEKYNNGLIGIDELRSFTSPKLQDAMNLSDEIIGIIRLDSGNNKVAECGLAEAGTKLSDFVFENTALSSFFRTGNTTAVVVSAPILSREGKRLGTDLVIIDTCLLDDIIFNSEEGSSGIEAVVGMMSEGKIIPLVSAHGDEEFSQKSINLYSDIMLKAINGMRGMTQTGSTAIVYEYISECSWGLIVTQDSRELYSGLYEKLWKIGILYFIIYLFTLTGFYLIMNPLAGRMLIYSSELEEKIREKTSVLEEEIGERKRSEKEKEAVISDLKIAMEKIKKLQGLLPICAGCKKIRDDKGYWNQIEVYIRENSEADFTHGICPDCLAKYYSEGNNTDT